MVYKDMMNRKSRRRQIPHPQSRASSSERMCRIYDTGASLNKLRRIADRKYTRLYASAAAVLVMSSTASDCAAQRIPVFDEPYQAIYTINTTRSTPISGYIFGINDNPDLAAVTATVLKQNDVSATTYNWENNASNSGTAGGNANDLSLVSAYSSASWKNPGLYPELLCSRASKYDIPFKLATLQMMGYVAGDSLGVVSDDELSRSTRWAEVRFAKNDAYSTRPESSDKTVYMDEYISFLVDKYGTSDRGGINGYFLDNEPDKWAKNFVVTGIGEIDPPEFIDRSAHLAQAVRTIDSKALIFGPSLSGLSGCVSPCDPHKWDREYADKYPWFIDYYLINMRKKSEEAGVRLLDVLDVHYFTAAQTPLGATVIDHDDNYSNAYRMKAVRTLWDTNYSENSPIALNNQYTPFITNLSASISVNYPGTALSISEYDFGGGSNMSGAIAEIDALGTFAKEGVYLACLSPRTEDHSFQNAAINLFTDYDGLGSSFGSELLDANNSDTMGSVYAGSDPDSKDMRVIVTNQNLSAEKLVTLDIKSDDEYEVERVFTIDDSADIVEISDDILDIQGNKITFNAAPYSVYLIELNGIEEEFSETETDFEEEPVTESEETDAVTEDNTQTQSETAPTEKITTVPDETEDTQPASDETTVPVTNSEPVQETTEVTSLTEVTDIDPENEETVPFPLKAAGITLSGLALAGVLYVLIFDKK